MITRDELMTYNAERKKLNPKACAPFFEILLLEKHNQTADYYFPDHAGPITLPDFGITEKKLHYDDLDEAIQDLNTNAEDMYEYYFQAAFILCRFPGLEAQCSKNTRMYFLWNDAKDGYFQQEEPEILRDFLF